jgi:spore germination protein GerM
MKRALVAALVVVAALVGWWLWATFHRPAPEGDTGVVETVREVTLYFARPDASGLVPEPRSIEAGTSSADNLRRTMEALVAGPREGGVRVLPSSARLLGVYIRNKTAFIDFSREISDDFAGGTAGERMMISSVVQTACGNFPEVDGVRLLVEGREVDTIGGHLRVSGRLVPGEWR